MISREVFGLILDWVKTIEFRLPVLCRGQFQNRCEDRRVAGGTLEERARPVEAPADPVGSALGQGLQGGHRGFIGRQALLDRLLSEQQVAGLGPDAEKISFPIGFEHRLDQPPGPGAREPQGGGLSHTRPCSCS